MLIYSTLWLCSVHELQNDTYLFFESMAREAYHMFYIMMRNLYGVVVVMGVFCSTVIK